MPKVFFSVSEGCMCVLGWNGLNSSGWRKNVINFFNFMTLHLTIPELIIWFLKRLFVLRKLFNFFPMSGALLFPIFVLGVACPACFRCFPALPFPLKHNWFKWMGGSEASAELDDIWIMCISAVKHVRHVRQGPRGPGLKNTDLALKEQTKISINHHI